MSYVYFICRETLSMSLTDFIGKIGMGRGNRWKCYGTAYGNDYTTYLWNIKNARQYEKKILSLCLEKGWLRKHSSGKISEVLNIEINENMTVKRIISLYKDRCMQIINMMTSIMGSEPCKLLFSDVLDIETNEDELPEKIEISVKIPYRRARRCHKPITIHISDEDTSSDYAPSGDDE